MDEMPNEFKLAACNAQSPPPAPPQPHRCLGHLPDLFPPALSSLLPFRPAPKELVSWLIFTSKQAN